MSSLNLYLNSFKIKRTMTDKRILNKKTLKFLEEYLNNASPTGYEWTGQKL